MASGGTDNRLTATSGECIREWVLADFGIDLTSVEGVGDGADGLAELWRARSLDGRSYAVKLTGGGTPAGLVVSSHLAQLGVSGVRHRLISAANPDERFERT